MEGVWTSQIAQNWCHLEGNGNCGSNNRIEYGGGKNEALKSRGSVGRRVGRPIARIAVLNKFCVMDGSHDSRTNRDTPTVESMASRDLKEGITYCSNEYTIKLIIYVSTIYLLPTCFDLSVDHLQDQYVYINKIHKIW